MLSEQQTNLASDGSTFPTECVKALAQLFAFPDRSQRDMAAGSRVFDMAISAVVIDE